MLAARVTLCWHFNFYEFGHDSFSPILMWLLTLECRRISAIFWKSQYTFASGISNNPKSRCHGRWRSSWKIPSA
jgi:hypothetical protein